MASTVFTGTATGHEDLLTKVVNHLTTGLGSQNWTVLKTDTSITDETHKYLKGPGLSATDNIHVNIRTYKSVSNDRFNWAIRGAINFNTLLTFANQPSSSPEGYVPLWDSSTPYWLIANGRRFILIAKISTTYQTCYCGFYLPYGTSSEMPYPIAILTAATNSTQRWSSGVYTVGGFWDPVQHSSSLRHFDGAWLSVYNYVVRTDGVRQEYHDTSIWPFHIDTKIGYSQDGTYGLLPAILHSSYSNGNVFGELEGVYRVSGISNAAEDTVTVGADTYLVVQSAYRTNNRDYAAIKLG